MDVDLSLLDKYIRLHHRYESVFITSLICEHFRYESLGFTSDEAYQLVANRLATEKNWHRCLSWGLSDLERKVRCL